jgi:hypothetical protein
MKRTIRKLPLIMLAAGVIFFAAGICLAADDPFARFIKPVTNPVYFDEAQNISYVHVVNAYQDLPKRISTKLGRVPLNGHLNMTAVRATYAFNEKFSLIAAKDGYIDFKPEHTLDHDSGWGDISAGFKYALYYCPQEEFIVSGKLLFEFSQGTRDVFQGNGDGNAAPSVTLLKGYDKWQVMGTLGMIIPFNAKQESTEIYQSYHVSYALTPSFFPLIELNHFCVARQGGREELVSSIAKFEGGDVINLGSQHGIDHRNLVTMAAGFRYRIFEKAGVFKNLDFGFAYELPITNPNDGLMDDRYTADLVLHF